jgi:CheY-like chemotaxis protein
MLRRVIRADVAIETSLSPDAGRIRADRGQIEQVVVNLAVNAGDAMPGGGTLTIATSSTELDADYFRLHPAGSGTPGRYSVLEVQDTGVGIDEETLAHVFEPFFTTKEADEGTGLGLATVYGIVQQSGGFVWAYSEPGQGSTFKVYLPTVEAAVEVGAERPPQALISAGGRTVLLVEDDPTVRSVVRRMLEAHGFAILEAAEGDAALELSDARTPGSLDLLVTDTVVPGPGGTALADRVRRRHPALRTVIMSGYSEALATGDVPLEPGTEFIAKPFGPEDLNAKLRTLLA